MWIKSDTPPTEPGYYLTLYFNEEQQTKLFKAFYYNPIKEKWSYNPRWSFDPNNTMICWWNVKHDFYTPCQIQENVDKVPDYD